MTWYEDVDARLDGIETRLGVIETVLGRMVRTLALAPAGAPAGEPPERSVPAVTPVAEDPSDEEYLSDLPTLPPNQCKHQHQALDQATKRIVCAQCRIPLTDVSGVLQTGVVTKSGTVQTTVAADQLPDWARAARETEQE